MFGARGWGGIASWRRYSLSVGGRPEAQEKAKRKPRGPAYQAWQPMPLYRQPCVIALATALAAVQLDHYLEPKPYFWNLAALLALVCAWGMTRWRLQALLILAGCLMGNWHAWQQRAYAPNDLVALTDDTWKPMVLRARIVGQVEHRALEWTKAHVADASPWGANVDVRITEVRVGNAWKVASGDAQLMVQGRLDDLLYGDLVQLNCRAARPSAPTNPGEPDLRFAFFASRQLVRLQAEQPAHVRCIESGSWSFMRWVAWLTRRGERALQFAVGPEHGLLATAIVLGRRGAVPESLRDDLVETGTVHLAVVSGMHLSLVAIAITWITNAVGLRPKHRALWILVGCSFYALATGFRPPVVRALMLVGFVWMGRFGGRRTDSMNLLAAASLVLLICNPAWLNQLGTQLSVLAVIGLLLAERNAEVEPQRHAAIDRLIASKRSALSRWFYRQTNNIRYGVRSSMIVFMITTPLLWHHFHLVSTISVVANLIISPLLFVALLSGLGAVVCGTVWEPAAIPAGNICRWMLQLTEQFTRWLSDLPGSHLWLPGPGFVWMFVYYVGLIVALLLTRTQRCKYVVIWSGVWYGVFLGVRIYTPHYPEQLQMTFVDVGHGTCVLIQPADGLPWLYDAGRMGLSGQPARPMDGVLWSEGISHLGGIVLSHADSDHYSAVAALSRRFRIDQVLVSPSMFIEPPPRLIAMREALERAQIPLRTISKESDVVELSPSLYAKVLHPPEQWDAPTDNARSIVWHVGSRSLDHVSVLLPGDLEGEGIEALIDQDRMPAQTLLMAPHHGSLTSDPLPLIEWGRPAHVVVSGGRLALRPAVESRLSQTGSHVWITARDGAVRFRWSPQGIEGSRFRFEPW